MSWGVSRGLQGKPNGNPCRRIGAEPSMVTGLPGGTRMIFPASTIVQKQDFFRSFHEWLGRSCWPGMPYIVGRFSNAQLISSARSFQVWKRSPAKRMGTWPDDLAKSVNCSRDRAIALSQSGSAERQTGGFRERWMSEQQIATMSLFIVIFLVNTIRVDACNRGNRHRWHRRHHFRKNVRQDRRHQRSL